MDLPIVCSDRRPRYLGCHVLVIDELGFQALDRRDAHRLFQLVNFRYERASTIITSNKTITEWPAMLAGHESLAPAILDRLLHHCHVLQMDGSSYRLRLEHPTDAAHIWRDWAARSALHLADLEVNTASLNDRLNCYPEVRVVRQVLLT